MRHAYILWKPMSMRDAYYFEIAGKGKRERRWRSIVR